MVTELPDWLRAVTELSDWLRAVTELSDWPRAVTELSDWRRAVLERQEANVKVTLKQYGASEHATGSPVVRSVEPLRKSCFV